MTPEEQKQVERITAIITAVEERLQADLLIYNGDIESNDVESTVQAVLDGSRESGGSPVR